MKLHYLKFGQFHLDPADHLLLQGEKPVSLPPKAFDTLVYLAQNAGRLVTREELIGAVWPNSFVEDGSLSVNISVVRRALGEMEDGEPYIETVPRKGYRFRSEVQVQERTAPQRADEETRQAVEAAVRTAPSVSEAGRRGWITGAAALLLVTAVGLAVFWANRRVPGTVPFASMTIGRVTLHGAVSEAAISLDGKYLAYVLSELKGESIWIRQVAAPGNIRTIGPEAGEHSSLVFSPDGDYLYYVVAGENGTHALYRMPLLGGSPRKVLPEVAGPISLSPSGQQVAFVRLNSANGEASLMVGDVNGSGLRRIATRARPRYFSPEGVAWFSDGRSIVCFAGDAADYGAQAFHLVKVNLTDGREQNVGSHSWSWVGPIVSEKDGHNLFVTASEQAEDALQIWRVSLPDGKVSRITNDLSNYSRLSSTADGKTLAAVHSEQIADLWTAPSADPQRAVPISAGNISGLRGLSWTADGRIAYTAWSGDVFNIFVDGSNGHDAKQLTMEPGQRGQPAPTPDGRYMLYQMKGKIWRVNQDGTHALQLTFQAHDVHPAATPDSQSVVYASFGKWSPSIGGEPALWSVSINGGRPTQLTKVSTSLPKVSPDGKWIAAAYFPDGDPRFSAKDMAIFSREGGAPLKVFRRPAEAEDSLEWAPGGKDLDYIVTTAGVGNIWRQPLDGGPAKEITHFNSDQLFDFAWSRDGRQLALLRGRPVSDVVLFRDSP